MRVEIQTEVGSLVTGIRIPGVVRNGGDLGSIGQDHNGSVHMEVKSLVIVVRDSAFWRLILHVPVDLALCTHDNGSGVRLAFHSPPDDALALHRRGCPFAGLGVTIAEDRTFTLLEAA